MQIASKPQRVPGLNRAVAGHNLARVEAFLLQRQQGKREEVGSKAVEAAPEKGKGKEKEKKEEERPVFPLTKEQFWGKKWWDDVDPGRVVCYGKGIW